MSWRSGRFEICPCDPRDLFLPSRTENSEHDDLLHRGGPRPVSFDLAEMVHEKVEFGQGWSTIALLAFRSKTEVSGYYQCIVHRL